MKLTAAAPWALCLATLWPLQAHALFGDDEARKAIIELRQKVDANKQAADTAAAEAREGDASTRRSLLELSNQIEQLRAELARLRGQNEQLAREVSELQRQQKDVQVGIDERLRQVEPLRIEFDGQTFTAAPAEKADFEAAMAQLRKSEFQPAVGSLRVVPAALSRPAATRLRCCTGWATRNTPTAPTRKRWSPTVAWCVSFLAHMRTPEAMLAMANSHVELKDSRTAKSTLENLVKSHPNSEAAAAARERLARLR